MERIEIEADRKAFGFQVTTFPGKVSDAFDALMHKIPHGGQRSYYGISWMEGDTIVYYAAAEQKSVDEPKLYGAREFTIQRGTYLVEKISDWMPKVGLIKGIFETMMKDPQLDLTSPAIEWYRSDDEMWCMMRLK
ncbi:MAG TPA: hypothetical protein VGD65_04165 [Chryseosolibacter sp.]